MNENYRNKCSLSDEFLKQAAKLKMLCPGILELKFNENGSVIVTRNNSNLVKRPLRNKKNSSNIKEKYENIDSYLLQSCTQAANKNSKTNSPVLDKILDEVGGENHAITWENINTRLESIFGCDEILKVPEEIQKKILRMDHLFTKLDICG
ncbi:hypothetical protein C2G38_2039163 [Gigaspora rosea]|uniref:Uncharacterized protein n=1 Tax=Gigaspora rosea TaxID=44941 RepID=A0A397V8R9_9GLOM|nr:hypothetical protein C2G38_2039163 [Gigaspora rosea]